MGYPELYHEEETDEKILPFFGTFWFFQLYRNNLIAEQCSFGEEYVLGKMLKRWKVADKNKQQNKPPYWSGWAVAADEAIAIAKVCWQNRTVMDVDRGYRWSNPAAECVSAAV